MNYPNYDGLEWQHAANAAARVSQWIDDEPANKAMTPLEQLLMRTVVKTGEEFGEACGAIIGVTGQNPRKGVTHTMDQFTKELLDKAATIVLGVEHITGNKGEALRMLADHIVSLEKRVAESRHRHGEPGGVAP
jgi:hypothetical protein